MHVHSIITQVTIDRRGLWTRSWDTKVEVIFTGREVGRVFWKAELSTLALENECDPGLPAMCL